MNRRLLIPFFTHGSALMGATATAVSAHAAVADAFECSLRLTDSTGAVTFAEATSQASADRIPLLSLPPTTNAQLSLGLKSDSLQATLNLQYQHAEASGTPQAFQWTCLSMSYCDLTSPDGLCAAEACPYSDPDPSKTSRGWTPVPINNGIPAFDPGRLVESSWVIGSERVLRGSCTHLRTLP